MCKFSWKNWDLIFYDAMQDNMKKMLEKAEKMGKSGVSCSTIKSFFNAHTDDQLNNAMKQLEGRNQQFSGVQLPNHYFV